VHYLLGVQIDESVPPPTGADREASFARVGVVNDDMKAKGIWVFAGGLLPSESTTVVREQNGTTTMTDGPFAETKEQIGGVMILDADDLDEAIAIAARIPVVFRASVELRPVIEH
jgi:hypothetical protein